MKFSVRLLLAAILIIAVLIQSAQVIIDREEVMLLEPMVADEHYENIRLHASLSSEQRQFQLCETVLEESNLSLELYLAAKQRFDRMQSIKVSD